MGDMTNPTDLGNAQRFVAQHGDDVRFVHASRTWLVWDGRRWAKNETGEVMLRAKQTARSIMLEAAELPDTKACNALAQHALRSEGQRSLNAMVELATTEPSIPVQPMALDADGWLLNCLNGTLDLRTGELREHRREDLITKVTKVGYDRDAYCETFARFIERILPDPEVQMFVQRAAGYTLLGDPREEVLFFVYGPPASGKSTLLEGMKAALADYAATADFETFLQRRDSGGPRPDIARLAGARYVASLEVDDGKHLAAGLVKQLVGRDTITARALYAAEFEFRPQFTLWLAANDEPKVSDADAALWRRIVQIPFDQTIPAEERDPDIKASIIDPKRSGPALLAWMVQGLRDYLAGGLRPPEAVRRATEAYRDRQDPLREWFAECLEVHPAASSTAAELFASYCGWCDRAGVRNRMSRVQLGKRLTQRGFHSRGDRSNTREGLQPSREVA